MIDSLLEAFVGQVVAIGIVDGLTIFCGVAVNLNALFVNVANVADVHHTLVLEVHLCIEAVPFGRKVLQHASAPEIHIGEQGM